MENQKIKTYRDLIVWQKAMALVTEIYDETKHFPKDEMYGITQQIRRCAVSVPSNIAEGFGRKSKNEYVRFLEIAQGSLFELQTQLEIAKSLQYTNGEKSENLYTSSREIERMLSSLIRKIKEME